MSSKPAAQRSDFKCVTPYKADDPAYEEDRGYDGDINDDEDDVKSSSSSEYFTAEEDNSSSG
ncbi:unnamed protein product, partial [Larinioides sclopetarius]